MNIESIQNLKSIALSIGAYLVFQHLVCVVALVKKRNDYADLAWGWGFWILIWANFFLSALHTVRALVLAILVSVWTIRLSTHLGRRVSQTKEDPRYMAMRKSWKGSQNWNSYVRVFLVQSLLLLVVALPLEGTPWMQSSEFKFLDYLGATLFFVGLVIEAVADWQLSKFVKSKKPGQIIQTGLWKYSRHPNYFGEIMLWWGLGLISLASGAWWTLAGPIFLNFLILKVSGVPLVEARYAGNAEYESYKKRTSRLIPRSRLFDQVDI